MIGDRVNRVIFILSMEDIFFYCIQVELVDILFLCLGSVEDFYQWYFVNDNIKLLDLIMKMLGSFYIM